MRPWGQSPRCERLRPLAIACALSWSVILSSCATTTGSGAIETPAAFCDVAKPIAWSARDTDGTIAQVKEHNAVGVALCGWGKAE